MRCISEYHHTVIRNATPSGDFTKWCVELQNGDMDIQAARRQALLRYIRDHHDGNVTEFAAAVGKSQSQIAWMLKGKKPFGERVARSIERAAAMPHLWLDREADDTTQPVGQTIGLRVAVSRWKALSRAERAHIEAQVESALQAFESRMTKKRRQPGGAASKDREPGEALHGRSTPKRANGPR